MRDSAGRANWVVIRAFEAAWNYDMCALYGHVCWWGVVLILILLSIPCLHVFRMGAKLNASVVKRSSKRCWGEQF